MTFTAAQQKKHRASFIEECRQKAWGATCHADWISKNLDGLFVTYQKLQAEEKELKSTIDELAVAPDYHTVDNREKRKTMEQRRTAIAAQLNQMGESARQAEQAMAQLLQSAESSLALAAHGETWEWKEADGVTTA